MSHFSNSQFLAQSFQQVAAHVPELRKRGSCMTARCLPLRMQRHWRKAMTRTTVRVVLTQTRCGLLRMRHTIIQVEQAEASCRGEREVTLKQRGRDATREREAEKHRERESQQFMLQTKSMSKRGQLKLRQHSNLLTHVSDLISDEPTNKHLLTWLKRWDSVCSKSTHTRPVLTFPCVGCV